MLSGKDLSFTVVAGLILFFGMVGGLQVLKG